MTDAERSEKAGNTMDEYRELYYTRGIASRRRATILPILFFVGTIGHFFFTGDRRALVMALPWVGFYL